MYNIEGSVFNKQSNFYRKKSQSSWTLSFEETVLYAAIYEILIKRKHYIGIPTTEF